MFKINKLFILGVLVIISVYLTGCSSQDSKNTSINTQSINNTSETQVENEIKKKITEIDKEAQQGKYFSAYGDLKTLKLNNNYKLYFDNHSELVNQIDTKLVNYDFQGRFSDYNREITNNNFSQANLLLEDILKRYNKNKDFVAEVKKTYPNIINKIEVYLNQEKKYNIGIEGILTYIAINSNENKDVLKKLYELNQSYSENKNSLRAFNDNVNLYSKTDEQLKKEASEIPVEPSVGMSKTDVENSTWGKPKKVNETITANNKHEQWVYQGDKYIYFENGVVTAIQK